MEESVLKTKRFIAAEASGGVSSDPIYSLFEQELEKLGLSGECLDFGAGTGILTKRLYNQGRFTQLTAVDLMQRPLDLPEVIEWVSTDINEPLAFCDQSFDVIVAAEVIEHLENPRAVMREWYRVLQPGGTVLFSTPNNESWRSVFALVFRGHYAFFGDKSYPAHITALLRKDIERICTEAGFSSPVFFYTDVGTIPKIPKLYWQTISGGLLKGLRYSDNLMAIARKSSS